MGEAARKAEMAYEAGPKSHMADKVEGPSTNFDEAVAKAVDDRINKLRDEMFAVMQQPKVTGGGMELLAPVLEALGMKIANIADQANGRAIGQRVEPEVLQRRELSYKKMIEMIADAQRRGVMPEYRLTRETVLDYGPGLGPTKVQPFYLDPATKAAKETEIHFDGIPNEAMSPIDDEAKAIYQAYRGWIGDPARVANQQVGITSSGVMVKGSAVQSRNLVRQGDADAPPTRQRPNVRVSHLEKGVLGTPKHILGSIHAPVVMTGGV